MNPEPLLRAVVSAMMLLEDCGPGAIDPDTVTRGLDHLGHDLLDLTGTDRNDFLALVDRMAATENDRRTAQVIRELPLAIGMVGAS
ncbi:hypothetical protein [Kitasatospora paranensis]|uniref:Uncharacterized protein n=1 Tax=Kitasatospora paranensis TaxID=258053 RepID=A0ABW2FV42_9ACTN